MAPRSPKSQPWMTAWRPRPQVSARYPAAINPSQNQLTTRHRPHQQHRIAWRGNNKTTREFRRCLSCIVRAPTKKSLPCYTPDPARSSKMDGASDVPPPPPPLKKKKREEHLVGHADDDVPSQFPPSILSSAWMNPGSRV
jgi:hypothetical protein